MKMRLFFTAILVSGLLFSTGCEKIKSLLDVEFDANYNVDINITVPAPGSVKAVQGSFEGNATIDPTSNPDVSKYLNLIKSWHVNELTGTFKNVSKDAILQTGTLSFSSDAGTASWTVTNVQIKDGSSFTLDNANGQWDNLDKILSAKKEFNVHFSGTTDKDDFTFTLSVEVHSTITANPLGSK